MIEIVLEDAEERMQKSIAALEQEMSKIRTGRAHTSLLDHITVEYYGNTVPLSQAATINVADPRTLTVTPWEKDMVQPVEKAIMESDLGLNPNTAGTVIRVPLPAMTEERRRDLTKVARQEAENSRVAIRNIRRDANGDLKALVKDKEISEDEERRASDQVQKLTDKYVDQVDKRLADKEKDLMEI
ncbi:MAG: ribosome recycling factor [Pseudomonadota bacterium]